MVKSTECPVENVLFWRIVRQLCDAAKYL
jgi:hypothetical protein